MIVVILTTGAVVILSLTVLMCADIIDITEGGGGLCLFIVIIAFIGYIGMAVFAFANARSDIKCQLINAQYGTEFTPKQVFWASGAIQDIINKDIQEKTQKYNININKQGE